MTIFSDNCTIKEVSDLNVPLLLMIRDSSEEKPFDTVNIMNFSAQTSCDYQIDKNASGGFTYNTFGKGMYLVKLDGFQAPGSNLQKTSDIESYYDKYCISSPERMRLRITAYYSRPIGIKDRSGNTVTTDSMAHAEAVTYCGYMTSFVKKPFGSEKVPGYGFTIDLVCERSKGGSA